MVIIRASKSVLHGSIPVHDIKYIIFFVFHHTAIQMGVPNFFIRNKNKMMIVRISKQISINITMVVSYPSKIRIRVRFPVDAEVYP